MNLYVVMDNNYDWCVYVFDVSRNRARIRMAESYDVEYVDTRCKTLKKGLNVPKPMLVDDDSSEGYDIILELGYRYLTDEEIEEEYDRMMGYDPFLSRRLPNENK